MKFEGKLWLDLDGYGAAGQGRIKLLELIEETGSITKAAKAMKMSYKAAWDGINNLNEAYGKPLVERQAGGKGGGGTRLTQEGQELIQSYKYFSRMNSAYLQDLSNANRIKGKIISISGQYATAETGSGDIISCTLMDETISESSEITLLIRPADIILIDSDGFNTSAKNIFNCKISSLAENDTFTDVHLSTTKGTKFKASITSTSAKKLSLKIGKEIFILFKTTSVVA